MAVPGITRKFGAYSREPAFDCSVGRLFTIFCIPMIWGDSHGPGQDIPLSHSFGKRQQHQYKSVGARYLPGPGPVAEALRRLHYPAGHQRVAWETGWSPTHSQSGPRLVGSKPKSNNFTVDSHPK